MDRNLLYSRVQSETIDRYAIDDDKVSGYELMRLAGRRAYGIYCDCWPDLTSPAVVVGPGNNGGDGYVFAAEAVNAGMNPVVYELSEPKTAEAQQARLDFINCGGVCVEFDGGVANLGSDSIVDAIFGIGLKREPKDKWRDAIKAIQSSSLPVMSLDIPSGLDADTGAELGIAVRADITVAFITRKVGFHTGHGPKNCGKVFVESLNVSSEIYSRVDNMAILISKEDVAALLPRRSASAHKGSVGRVVIVGSNLTMEGAGLMAAHAAYRTGAGLVSLALKLNHHYAIAPFIKLSMAVSPEIRLYFSDQKRVLNKAILGADVIGIGPGLGNDQWAKSMWRKALNSGHSLVVDADALNRLAQRPAYNEDWVLTPHPGEAARLLRVTTTDVQANRPAAAQEIQKRYGGVCVLKGSGTLVVSASDFWVCDRGNSGMATAGMGDILTGVICALKAQGLSSLEAAMCGVWLHSKAADDCAQFDGEIGMMATDLLPKIRQNLNQLINASAS